jgi:hypothetical protein
MFSSIPWLFIVHCDILNISVLNYFQWLHIWCWICNSKSWDENINDSNKEYSNYCEVIDAVSFPNFSFLFNVVAAIDYETNANSNLFTKTPPYIKTE